MDTPSDDHRELLIPSIGLRALRHVAYKSLLPRILKANPGVAIGYPETQLLWDAIVHKIYQLVCACEREVKAVEVSELYLSN